MSKNARATEENEENASASERRNSTTKRRRNGDDKVIRFRCDFLSTQVKVMLARGWIQVSSNETILTNEKRKVETVACKCDSIC